MALKVGTVVPRGQSVVRVQRRASRRTAPIARSKPTKPAAARRAAPAARAFSWRAAGRHLVHGGKKVVTDVVDAFKARPVATTLVAAGLVGGALLFPPLGVVSGAVGVSVALWHTAHGIYRVVTDLKAHQPQKAEEDFEEIGEGLVSLGEEAAVLELSAMAEGSRVFQAIETFDNFRPVVTKLFTPSKQVRAASPT